MQKLWKNYGSLNGDTLCNILHGDSRDSPDGNVLCQFRCHGQPEIRVKTGNPESSPPPLLAHIHIRDITAPLVVTRGWEALK